LETWRAAELTLQTVQWFTRCEYSHHSTCTVICAYFQIHCCYSKPPTCNNVQTIRLSLIWNITALQQLYQICKCTSMKHSGIEQ